MPTKCEREDSFNATVQTAKWIQHRFDEGQLEVKIEFLTANDEVGSVFLDFGDSFIQSGNNAGKRSCELSRETLAHIGIQDIGNLSPLVGQVVGFYGKINSKGFINFFISKYSTTEVDQITVQNKLAMLFGAQQSTVQQAQPVSPAKQAQGQFFPPQQNPFGN